MLTEWEFINLQKIAPKWKFVFRGRKWKMKVKNLKKIFSIV
jgi:hypothetical protein